MEQFSNGILTVDNSKMWCKLSASVLVNIHWRTAPTHLTKGFNLPPLPLRQYSVWKWLHNLQLKPICPGPNCPLLGGRQLGPGAQLSWARMSRAQLAKSPFDHHRFLANWASHSWTPTVQLSGAQFAWNKFANNPSGITWLPVASGNKFKWTKTPGVPQILKVRVCSDIVFGVEKSTKDNSKVIFWIFHPFEQYHPNEQYQIYYTRRQKNKNKQVLKFLFFDSRWFFLPHLVVV